MTGRVVVHVQPRARRTEVAGLHGDAVKLRLAAPPVDGAANEELVRFVAERLGVARSAVRVTAGATARRKTLEVDGMDGERARRTLLGEARP